MTRPLAGSSIPVRKSAASARLVAKSKTSGYATVLFALLKDIEEFQDNEQEEQIDFAFEAHLPHLQWQRNPHRRLVEERQTAAVERALRFVAEMQKRPLPTTLVEALLLDTSLGIEPFVGDEICVGQHQ